MKLIDKYIIKKFLSTFIFTIILIISLAIVIDITEKIEDFIEKQAPLNAIIFEYYINFIPYYVNLFMFLFVFISVVFFTSKMASDTEVIAIISSGVSFKRFLYPFFVASLILAILSFLLSNFIIPPANKVRLNFEDTYVNGKYYNRDRNIHKQIEKGIFIYMESFRITTSTANKFSMEKFEDKKLVSKLFADKLKWDTLTKKWIMKNYYIREYHDNHEVITKGERLDTLLNITPEDFKESKNNTDKSKMNYFELNNYIAEKKLRGESNISPYLLEKYQRVAFPFSTFILTLIGVSLSSRKKRGGTGLNVGIGLIISFSYIFFMQISSQFTIKGNLSPMLSAWIPNIIFLIVALFLYRTAPK